MRTHHRAILLAFLSLISVSPCRAAGDADSPALVVLIAVDGLRADLLQRYDPALTGGFRRMLDTGFRFDNAYVDHAITVSHAGHVTLATGSHPSAHGIVDAAFYVPAGSGRVLVDAVIDTTESIPGIPQLPGVSPRLVRRDGITEWTLRKNANARTLSVGSGNVSSLLYAFHSPADVYWYRGAGYVTSSYYRDQIAPWVKAFNDSVVVAMSRSSRRWECTVPGPLQALAHADSAAFEGDKVHTTFPHTVEREMADYLKQHEGMTLLAWLGSTPFVDEATLLLAERGVDAMDLGQRGVTDCLTIVLSMLDSNSHYYGPHSLEAMDTLVRIDQALGRFFSYLDKAAGADGYVVALSSDHGFVEVPEYQNAHGKTGRRLTAPEIEALMADVRADSVAWSADPQIRDRRLDSRAGRVAGLLKGYDFVSEVYTPAQLAGTGKADKFLRLYRNSYRGDRVPRLPLFSLNTFQSGIGAAGVMVRLTEGTMIDIDTATHGSAYAYDRHVPLVFMGAGVKRGSSRETVRTVDVAPTLARLAGVTPSADIDGKPLRVN